MAPRPRKPAKPDDAPTTLSFQVDAELIRELEREIDTYHADHGARLSRTQLVKMLLKEALDARRGSKTKSR